MANNEAGAYLNITPDVLKRLQSFDEKLESIQKHAHTAADALKNGFGKAVLDTSKLEGAINNLANKIDALKDISVSVENIGTAAARSVTSVQNVTTSLMETAQIANSLSVSRPFEKWNIAQLKDEINSLNEALKEGTPTVRNNKFLNQQEIVDRRNALKEKLTIQEASTAAKLSAIAKVAKAQNADAEAQRKLDEKRLQEHLRGLEERTKREKQASEESLRIGTARLEAEKKALLANQRAQEKRNADLTKQYEAEQRSAAITEEANKRKAESDQKWYEERAKQRERNIQQAEEAARREMVAEANAKAKAQPSSLANDKAAMARVDAAKRSEAEINKERQKSLDAAIKRDQQEANAAKKAAQERLAAEKAVNREMERDNKAYFDNLNKRIIDAQKKQLAQQELSRRQMQAERSTVQGALGYSNSVKQVSDHATAIKYLEKAIGSLNEKDKNYKATLAQLNQAIEKHKTALQEAGLRSQSLANSHSKVMDTAGQLKRKLALVFSVSQIEGYISKVAQVRGEFELQQRSLQAILQNKTQADQIFNKTVEFAVKSPFQIKELVTYTKQLAAYRIESDKLFDTTKRLADVSAGLGVDMQRLILAYGQVKAAAYLRGTEVRQFTEAGINMYGELQAYFKEVKGEAYTTAEIVDMISKRKVTFADIEAIFKRMTDAGGLFYNMQEIQAETLQGKISNLRDSIDVMLNDIGKANEGLLKGSIDTFKLLIDNWQQVFNVIKALGPVIASVGLAAWNKGIIEMGKATSLLSLAMTKASAAVKTFGILLKSSLPTALIFGTIEAITHLIAVQKEYNEAQKEAEGRYYKGQLRTQEIEKLAVTIDENTSKPRIREALSQLVKEMNNEGFDINIDVNISDEDAQKQYDNLLKKHKKYLDDILTLDYAYNENKKNNSWFWKKDADEVNKDLVETRQKAIATVNDVRIEIAKLLDKGTGIDSAMRKELERLQQGVTESGSLEAIQKYYDEVLYYINKIKGSKEVWGGNFGMAGSMQTVMKNTYANMSSSVFDGISTLSNDLDKAKVAMTKVLREHFDNTFALNTYDNEAKAAMVNNFATAKGWDLDLVQQIASALYDIDFSVLPKNEDNPEPKSVDAKAQRDIMAERISTLKEMNKEYEKLKKVMGSDAAAATVMKRYADELRDIQMPKSIIGDNFLPTKENTAKALQELSTMIEEFRKRLGAQKDANVLLDENDIDKIQKSLESTVKEVNDLFNGLDLHKKLKDAGLTEAEVQQLFPGIAKTLDDVANGIKDTFKKNFPGGEYLTPDTEANKEYIKELDKLNQKRIKDSQDLVIELTKKYKTQLSDQLQLDRWYYEKRAKIQEANLTSEQKAQYEANLKMEYNRKSDANKWKQFQGSDMYISLFENVEGASTRMLEAMRDKLQSLRGQLKDLPADQLKVIINQQEKLDELISQKNPFKGLNKGIKEYIEFLKQRDQLEQDYLRSNAAIESYTEQRDEQSKIVQEKQQEYDQAVKLHGINSVEAQTIKQQLNSEKLKLSVILAQLDAEQKISNKTGEQLKNGQKLSKILGEKFSFAGEQLSTFSSTINEVAGSFENMFGTMSAGLRDTVESISEIAGGLGQAATGIGRVITNTADIGGWVQGVTGLVKSIGSIFNIRDKRKEREIQKQMKNIEKLQQDYDKLKESMDAAWKSATLQQETQKAVDSIDDQIEAYEAMIKAEEDKKKTDDDRIAEWRQEIEKLKSDREELLKQERLNLGGIGDDNEYKTAAENFVSSWMDAFKETGEGITGLEESFDEMIQNLIIKQATMRLAQNRLKSLFEMIDKSVTEDSAGGINLTREELANINALSKTALAGLNDDLKALMETLGYKGGSQTAELSALTESIQGITEKEAEALESLLNSIRFFVSQQTTDVTAIRSLLEARYAMETQADNANPMLVELRAQTGYLEQLTDYIGRVFAPSANSKGAGLRVFIS